jgi:hypothetical protein
MNPNRLGELHNAAIAKGGACLTPVYSGLQARYRFRCGKGHEREAAAAGLLYRGHWCRRCGLDRTKEANQSARAERLRTEALAKLLALKAAATAWWRMSG